VIGSVLSSRYQSSLNPVLNGRSVPAAAAHAILGSIGGALTVAGMAGGTLGHELASAARVAFINGMHGSLLVGAIVVALSAMLVLIALPARSRQQTQNPPLPPDVTEPQGPSVHDTAGVGSAER
jgi:hypothetical protein